MTWADVKPRFAAVVELLEAFAQDAQALSDVTARNETDGLDGDPEACLDSIGTYVEEALSSLKWALEQYGDFPGLHDERRAAALEMVRAGKFPNGRDPETDDDRRWMAKVVAEHADD